MVKIAVSGRRFAEKPTNINWADLNDSFRNHELDTMRLCNAIYCGHPFCAWMDGRRSEESFVLAQHLGVDMDTGDYRSSMDALVDHPLVRQYGAIIYQTPSHQSHAPKSRVLFLLDEPIASADGYRLALETVYDLFDGADPACVDPARFFYGNGQLLAAGNVDGIWFSENMHFPLTDLRTYTRQYLHHKQSSTETKKATIPQSQEPINLDIIAAGLNRVNSYAIDYRLWLSVCTGLKNEFGDAAFELARGWSEAPGKDTLTKKKWDSFGRRGKPVTIATVLKVIKEYAI